MSGDRRQAIDPAVAAILSDQDAKRATRRAPRAKAEKMRQQAAQEEAERERQERRHRVTLELDPVVFASLQKVASAEQVSPASAANWLLAQACLEYAQGDLDFSDCKRVTKSPRWPFTVDLGKTAGKLQTWTNEAG